MLSGLKNMTITSLVETLGQAAAARENVKSAIFGNFRHLWANVRVLQLLCSLPFALS